jgi:hypothetical protein
MSQKYTPQGNKLVPFPIMEEPTYESVRPHPLKDALEAYNQWLSLPQPLILDEKDFKEGEVYELDIHFRIEDRCNKANSGCCGMENGVCECFVAIPIVGIL